MSSTTIFAAAKHCIDACNPDEKCQLATALYRDCQAGLLSYDAQVESESIDSPGRPEKPQLVSPRTLAHRKLGTPEGRAAFLHAIAHIEFNAVNLACDAVYRFRDMPEEYYLDWARVASEEAYHFSLLQQRLVDMDYTYGDFDAHNGLWEMACKTAHDVLVRMALVPRVLEARGLDVTPSMIERLRKLGDEASVEILGIIFRDEIGHVEIGSRWFRFVCEQRGLDSELTFRDLLQEYMRGRMKGPFQR